MIEYMGKIEEFPRREIEHQAEFFVKRLEDECQTLRTLDSGDYPLKYYSSGEKKRIRAENGGWIETDEFVELPIWRLGRNTGLRNGVSKAIFSTYKDLDKLGYGKEAIVYINEMSTKKRDGDCEGK